MVFEITSRKIFLNFLFIGTIPQSSSYFFEKFLLSVCFYKLSMKLTKAISFSSSSNAPDHLKSIAFSSPQDQHFVRQTENQLVPSLPLRFLRTIAITFDSFWKIFKFCVLVHCFRIRQFWCDFITETNIWLFLNNSWQILKIGLTQILFPNILCKSLLNKNQLCLVPSEFGKVTVF